MTSPNLAVPFFEGLDSQEYLQPQIGQICSVPLSDLNAWRKRGIIHANVSKNPHRVLYSGRSILRIAIIHELAWAIGPTRAGIIAASLNTYFDNLRDHVLSASFIYDKPHELSDNLNQIITINRPKHHHETAVPIQIEPGKKISLSEIMMGMPWHMSSVDTLDLRNARGTIVTFPITKKLFSCAQRAGRVANAVRN